MLTPLPDNVNYFQANHKGTAASKKKKKAKLQRAIRSLKKKQRLSSANGSLNCYSPLDHLKDAQVCLLSFQLFCLRRLPCADIRYFFQGFAEKLFSRLQTCNERFEVCDYISLLVV